MRKLALALTLSVTTLATSAFAWDYNAQNYEQQCKATKYNFDEIQEFTAKHYASQGLTVNVTTPLPETHEKLAVLFETIFGKPFDGDKFGLIYEVDNPKATTFLISYGYEKGHEKAVEHSRLCYSLVINNKQGEAMFGIKRGKDQSRTTGDDA